MRDVHFDAHYISENKTEIYTFMTDGIGMVSFDLRSCYSVHIIVSFAVELSGGLRKAAELTQYPSS